MSSPKTPQSNIKRKRPAWSVFAIHPKRVWILSYSYSAQRRLIRLVGCPGWSESSLCVHIILLVLSCRGSIFFWNKLLIYLLHSKVTCYSMLENVLWRICLTDGRLKDCSLRHILITWAATWQNQQNECTPSEDSDQPGHPPSLNRVFAVRMKKAWVLSYPLSAQRRLWSDWADAQADLSLRWAHSHFVGFVMSRLTWLTCITMLWIISKQKYFLISILQTICHVS